MFPVQLGLSALPKLPAVARISASANQVKELRGESGKVLNSDLSPRQFGSVDRVSVH